MDTERCRNGDATEEGKPSYESGADAYKHGRDSHPILPSSKGDPFGDETNSPVKYKVMRWWQADMIMIAETISLGILSLPSILATIGFVGGMILILGLGILATYTGYVLGQFKLRYPQVHNMADAGEVLLGPVGREIFALCLTLLSDHGACSIAFGVVGMIVCLIFTLPRKLGDVSWMAIASFISIIGACVITMAGVGIENPGKGVHNATEEASFAQAFLSVTNIIFAYAGHVAFFSFISEFRNPEEYPKALFLLQGCDTAMYLLVASIIYAYAGPEVASPALSSTSSVLEKAAYGVAIPTIIIAGVINGHVASKYIYVRIFRGTGIMGEKSLKSYGSWALIALILWIIAWIVAEAIPIFNDLLGLISSLFASWFTYGLSGVFWIFMNKGHYTESKKKMFLTVLNSFTILLGAAIMVMGLYASGTAIKMDTSPRHPEQRSLVRTMPTMAIRGNRGAR